jgi:predicted ATPase
MCTSSADAPSPGPLQRYEEAIERGEITKDPLQVAGLVHLQRLHEELEEYALEVDDLSKGSNAAAAIDTTSAKGGGGFFSSLFGGKNTNESSAASSPTKKAPSGVYLWGGVGCGKTYIMDMFFEGAPVKRKARVHFHSFMLDIHNRMHALRREGVQGDPIPDICREIKQETMLICFDEFQVRAKSHRYTTLFQRTRLISPS